MPESRPNILLLTSHDTGRFLGAYGVTTVRTAHLDRLASEGVVFEQLTATSPLCSPSRGSLVTGRWPQRNGLIGLVHHGFSLAQGEVHAAARFAKAGFETTLFHFQHVADPASTRDLGFESFLCPSRDDPTLVYPDMARPAPEVGAAVAQWLTRRDRSRPFFAQVNFNETHTPFSFGDCPPDRSRGVTVPGWIQRDEAAEEHFAGLQGAVAQLDEGVGRILEQLDNLGLAENTLVVFTSDHGFEAARDKWTCYESGLGIAGLMRHPARGIGGGRRLRTPRSNIDLLPTILEIAGLDRPSTFDGVSLLPELLGAAQEARPVYGIYHNGGSRSVRVGDWKLIRNFSAEPYCARPPVKIRGHTGGAARPVAELYRLDVDPDELNNCAAQHPQQVQQLSAQLFAWMQQTEDPILR